MLDLKHELKLDKTRDEKARMNFVSGLRAHVLNDMAGGMRAVWDADVEPAFRRSRGRRPKDGPEVHAALKPNEYFKFYSSLRVTTQELVWQSVFPALERNRGALKEKAARLYSPDSRPPAACLRSMSTSWPATTTASTRRGTWRPGRCMTTASQYSRSG